MASHSSEQRSPDPGVPVGAAEAPVSADVYDRFFAGDRYGRSGPQPEIRSALQSALASLPGCDRARVLEIGTGRGLYQDLHPNYVALDVSRTALRRFLGGRTRVQASAETLPFRDGSFGFVFSVWVFEHLRSPDRAFAEVDRVLAPGGIAFLYPSWFCRSVSVRNRLSRRAREAGGPLPLLLAASLRCWDLRAFRLARLLPRRLLAEYGAMRGPTRIRFRPLEPDYSVDTGSDADATANIDAHEAVQFFRSRGYAVDGADALVRRLLFRHSPVVARKPEALHP